MIMLLGGKNINRDNAMSHVFGYAVMIDDSARDKLRAGRWVFFQGSGQFWSVWSLHHDSR